MIATEAVNIEEISQDQLARLFYILSGKFIDFVAYLISSDYIAGKNEENTN